MSLKKTWTVLFHPVHLGGKHPGPLHRCSWCAKVVPYFACQIITCVASVSNRVIAQKFIHCFLLSSRRSRRTRGETLATQASQITENSPQMPQYDLAGGVQGFTLTGA